MYLIMFLNIEYGKKNLFVIIIKNFFLLFLKLRCNVVVLLESYYDIFNVYFYL